MKHQSFVGTSYFDAVQNAVREGIVNRKDYRTLLLDPNKDGFTPLHSALKSGGIFVKASGTISYLLN